MPERYTRKRIQREANAFNLKRQEQTRAFAKATTMFASR
jgi:hypothetical protein